MKYLLLQDGNYYFRRKIPKTQKSFTFSLKSKNARIATKLISLFLAKAEPLFQTLKIENRKNILNNLNTIIELLENYKKKALTEYSLFEKERHKALSCTKKNGKKQDGGHPKCIKKWLKTYQNVVFSDMYENKNEIEQYSQEIFKRTNISENLLNDLSFEDRMEVALRVIKTEKEILQTDYNRAKSFKAGNIKVNPIAQTTIATQTSNKYYEKTAKELADEFISKKNNDTTELHKYSAPIEIFLKVINTKYLADVSAEQMTDFIFITKHLLPQTKKENKELQSKYKNNPMGLAQHVKENSLETITLKTAMEKIRNVGAFLQYAVDMERLDINRLSKNPNMPSRKEKEKRSQKEEETRTPFSTKELNKLFKSSWYTKHLKKHMEKGQDRIYIPLIALMSGMRQNEIAQLYVNDIMEEDNIYYFRVDTKYLNQKLKNTSAKRIVPIHDKLIELGFLDYINKLKSQNIERVFPQLGENKRGYGVPFGKKFSNHNFRKEWLNLEEIEANGETKVFHNFRHNFITKVKSSNKPQMVDHLVGHKTGNYNYEHISLYDLADSVNQLNYDDIDFSHIIKYIDEN